MAFSLDKLLNDPSFNQGAAILSGLYSGSRDPIGQGQAVAQQMIANTRQTQMDAQNLAVQQQNHAYQQEKMQIERSQLDMQRESYAALAEERTVHAQQREQSMQMERNKEARREAFLKMIPSTLFGSGQSPAPKAPTAPGGYTAPSTSTLSDTPPSVSAAPASLGGSVNPKVAAFSQQYGAAAQMAGERLGVDPSVLLAQWGHETAWGKSVIPGTNNLGNIKAPKGSGVMATDNMTGSRDGYRAYANPEEFANDFVSLIERKYPNAKGTGADAGKFGAALKRGGYAEDPLYVMKLQMAARMVPSMQAAQAGGAPDGSGMEQMGGNTRDQSMQAAQLGLQAGMAGMKTESDALLDFAKIAKPTNVAAGSYQLNPDGTKTHYPDVYKEREHAYKMAAQDGDLSPEQRSKMKETQLVETGKHLSSQYYDKLSNAPQQLMAIRTAREAATNLGTFQGSLADKKAAIANIVNGAFGTNISPEQLTNAAVMQSALMQPVILSIRGIDANPTQVQQKWLMESVGQLTTHPKALVQMLNMLEERINFGINKHNSMVDNAIKAGAPISADIRVKDMKTLNAENPMNFKGTPEKLPGLPKGWKVQVK